MKFEEIIPALREGKKARASWWENGRYIEIDDEGVFVDQDGEGYLITFDDFKYDDWEIIEKTKKIKLRDLTKRQYDRWIKKCCDEHCENCRFGAVECNYACRRSWINHKELYSDNFLNQEIEVEE